MNARAICRKTTFVCGILFIVTLYFIYFQLFIAILLDLTDCLNRGKYVDAVGVIHQNLILMCCFIVYAMFKSRSNNAETESVLLSLLTRHQHLADRSNFTSLQRIIFSIQIYPSRAKKTNAHLLFRDFGPFCCSKNAASNQLRKVYFK